MTTLPHILHIFGLACVLLALPSASSSTSPPSFRGYAPAVHHCPA